MIDGAIIKLMTFAAFNEFVTEAQGMQSSKMWEARLRRVRLSKQVVYFSGPAAIVLKPEDVLRMPIRASWAIMAKLDKDDDSNAGKIVRPGDGIDKAITFQLGTPLPGGQGRPPITELEFMAKTYGDVEDVLAAPNIFQQSSQLLATVAKPLGTTLSALPSWALSQITFADGFAIAREVLPHFLGPPAESPSD